MCEPLSFHWLDIIDICLIHQGDISRVRTGQWKKLSGSVQEIQNTLSSTDEDTAFNLGTVYHQDQNLHLDLGHIDLFVI